MKGGHAHYEYTASEYTLGGKRKKVKCGKRNLYHLASFDMAKPPKAVAKRAFEKAN